jgi:elongator complex protein 6
LKKYIDSDRFFYVDNLDLSTSVLSKGDPLKSTTDSLNKALSTVPSTQDVVLILDSPDLSLALNPSLSASTLQHAILTWRQSVHATIASLPTDFIVPEEHEIYSPDPLTLGQQQLLLGLAHQANIVMSTKRLDSGTAKDVSGVVRITSKGSITDKELLYLVDGGSVKGVEVWERGGLRG